MSVCEAAVYCLAGTVGFHAKQATYHVKTQRRLYPPDFRNYLSLAFKEPIRKVGARWTSISSLARIRFSEPLQEQQTKHADATAVVLREENKLSEPSAKACVIIDRVQYTQASTHIWCELCAAYLRTSSTTSCLDYIAEVGVRKAGLMCRTSARS